MSKKNIDELFKEQFKDFDEIPDPKVWENIENSLDKKKSRKMSPIWWKLGGAAAVLAIFFYAINPFDKAAKDTIEVSNTSDDKTRGNKDTLTPKVDEIDYKSNEEVQYSTTKEQNNEDLDSSKKQQENALKNSPSYVKNASSKGRNEKNSSQKTNPNKLKQSTLNTTDDLAVTKEKGKINGNKQNEEFINRNSNLGIQEKENAIASNKLEKENSVENSDIKGQEKKLNKEVSENSITIVTEENKKETETVVEKKKSIYDEIDDKTEKVVAESKADKWSVGPSVAPVYFNGLGEGSPISASFTPNSKSGDVNLSYGVSVAYGVSKKLKIRSGVYKVDYGYNTNDIEFTSSFGSNSTAKIANINYKTTSNSIIVESIASGEGKSNSPVIANDISAKSASLVGSLSQQFGYIEVPLELNYAVLNKRFGINVIGGVSSLFLIENNILLNSGNQTTEMGEANNINNVNFSTNFGFGINYKITPKLQFNVEPLFKYQLNTFSNSAGNFQPFSLGVYSGVNFKF